MQPFADLGALIETRWRQANYNETQLPNIAAQTLQESNLPARVDPWEIIRWVHTTSSLPRQKDLNAKFGNPPITLFVGPRFYIDVYYWLDGTTSIHQHAFSGAFQVLLGSSVHSIYGFEQIREINPHFLTGKIWLQNISLLTKGSISEIRPGNLFIHSLFHLERPSATIVVRSNRAPHDRIQYSYLKPNLALDPFFEEESLSRKVQTVSLLLSIKHPEADDFIGDLLDNSDFQTTFSILDTASRFLGRIPLEEVFKLTKSADRFRTMLDRAQRRHGELVDLLPPVFEEKRRQAEIVARRAMISNEDHRFFLALLLNVPERTQVLDLIKQKLPNSDPIDQAVTWIKELGTLRNFGSRDPNVLGFKDFDLSHLAVFAGLLRGLSDEEIRMQTSNQLSRQLSADEVMGHIRALPLFKLIFAPQTS